MIRTYLPYWQLSTEEKAEVLYNMEVFNIMVCPQQYENPEDYYINILQGIGCLNPY